MPLNYSNATEPYHIWVPRDPLGGIPWGGIPWGADGTLGPMGPWDRWDLGLKDPGPQGPPIMGNKKKNNNNNNIGRFPGGGLGNQNPARTIAHSPPGVKETLNYMLREKREQRYKLSILSNRKILARRITGPAAGPAPGPDSRGSGTGIGPRIRNFPCWSDF